MTEFSTSLLREKFTIKDAMPADMADSEPVIALSNRLALLLKNEKGQSETIIVRAQNMHSCARLAAHIAREFQDNGPLMTRAQPYAWGEAWQSVIKGFEKSWNPNRWAALYHKGRVIFEDHADQARHPFLDIIEQCEARNKGDYGQAVKVAEDAFRQAGKLVNINHDSNVALVMNVEEDEGKCGVIVRGPARTTTFNFTARRKKKGGEAVKPSQCLTVAAAFLEGIQLAFFVGMTRQKLAYEMIEPFSADAKKAEDGSHKLARLNTAISQFEQMFDVNYRPDRPEFSRMIDEAETFARKILAAEIEKRMQEGGDAAKGWVV
jgi:hypothetical protein